MLATGIATQTVWVEPGGHLLVGPVGWPAAHQLATVQAVGETSIRVFVTGGVDWEEGSAVCCRLVNEGAVQEFRAAATPVADETGASRYVDLRLVGFTAGVERRRSRRVQLSTTVLVRLAGDVELSAMGRDISIGGLRFEGRCELGIGQRAHVELDLPDGQVAAHVQVVAVAPTADGCDLRCMFLDLKPHMRELIRNYVMARPGFTREA